MKRKHRFTRLILNIAIALGLILGGLLASMGHVLAEGPPDNQVTVNEDGEVEDKQPSDPQQRAWWWGGPKGPETQVVFYAGDTCDKQCKVKNLTISGYNQNNHYRTWKSHGDNLETSISIPNWWWKPSRGIYLAFDISGGERGHCYYQKGGHKFKRWLRVTYKGNYKCKFKFSDKE